MTAVTTLIVDGANVVGSRPDGWWRDRPGAAARLQAQLLAADLAYDEVVLVLEGKARAGVPEGTRGRTHGARPSRRGRNDRRSGQDRNRGWPRG